MATTASSLVADYAPLQKMQEKVRVAWPVLKLGEAGEAWREGGWDPTACTHAEGRFTN